MRFGKTGPDVVKPIVAAFRVLEELAGKVEGKSLAEVASATGLSKTSVHRYMRTLQLLGYVSPDRIAGGYLLGAAIWDLSTEDSSETILKAAASDTLEELHRTFDETVNLGRPKGRRIHYLRVIESGKPLRMRAGQGDADCFHCTALGKSVLAHVPAKQVADFLNEPLQQFTPHTITNRRRLLEELSEVRRQGFAVDREENEIGAVCFGSPILGRGDLPIAAVSVSVPSARLTTKLDLAISDAVTQAAKGIAQRLMAFDRARAVAQAHSKRGFGLTRSMPNRSISEGNPDEK